MTERIDFISAYCDRWCERCRYTERCSVFACRIASAMCGGLAAGIELAVGAPHPVEAQPTTNGASWLSDGLEDERTPEEIAAIGRAERARDARLDAMPLARLAMTYVRQSTAWFDQHHERRAAACDPLVGEALEIASWDAYLIGGKVHRAVWGRDRWAEGDLDCDDPAQSDWNGSAKVALISLARSEAAWHLLAEATGDVGAAAMAERVATLRRQVEHEFPRAMSFVRPGFDEPWR